MLKTYIHKNILEVGKKIHLNLLQIYELTQARFITVWK